MLCFPNAKINLGLYVTHKRADGYHDLETVFYPVMLRDMLEIVPAEEASMYLTGAAIDGGTTDNLVWKAFQLLKKDFRQKIKEVDIYLHKLIPMGAGMGGGSADGAFMLQLLNNVFRLGLDKQQLASYALQLGSDCPFFIFNTPQYATGRGEQLAPISIDLSGYDILLVYPNVHVSTAKAFSMITPAPSPFDLRMLSALPVALWKDNIANDFEKPVFAMHPELQEIKEELYGKGAVYASMTGSGSSLYGIFDKGIRSSLSIHGHKTYWV